MLTLFLHSSITVKITTFLGRAGSSSRQDYALAQFLVPKAITYNVLIVVMFYRVKPFPKRDISIMQILVTSQKLNRKYFSWRSKQSLLSFLFNMFNSGIADIKTYEGA